MEKIKTTLHPKDSPNDELYPNVLPSNIPVDESLDNTTDVLKVTLKGGDGISINGNTIGIADNFSNEKTFTNGVKTNKITDLNGYKIVEDNNSYITIGNTSRITRLQGSNDRLTYNGEEIALLKDFNRIQWDTLMANLGVGRWANQTLIDFDWITEKTIYDDLAPYYTSCVRYLAYANFGTIVRFNNPKNFFNSNKLINYNFMLAYFGLNNSDSCTVYLPSMYGNMNLIVIGSNISHLLVDTDCVVQPTSLDLQHCPSLIEVGEIDMSYCGVRTNFTNASSNIETLNIINIRKSLSFEWGTDKLTLESLIHLVQNLLKVDNTQTLSLRSACYERLMNDETGKAEVEKAINERNWNIANLGY